MKFERAGGILLHPTSLPGRFGIGDLGENAYRFVDMLIENHQKLWQICPLGPPGEPAYSPYQCFSAFAGNPMLINLEKLAEQGLVEPDDLNFNEPFDEHTVDYFRVAQFKTALLKKAHVSFQAKATSAQQAMFEGFCRRQSDWLEDYALFMALREQHQGAAWNTWEPELVARYPDALNRAREECASRVAFQKFVQYLFTDQWLGLRAYANRNGVKIIGDIPIFVSLESADVWSNPELFFLDERGNPEFVAGVPPDYFSETGQLWGNPVYRWSAMKEQGYAWWIARFAQAFQLTDIVRVDHFRGFAAYWSIPAGEETAINGIWEPGPGEDLFRAVERELDELPIIAEDLGLITPDVTVLRDALDFPGMKVLHFAFDGSPKNDYLPHNYTQNCVVYTGTHDNDTTLGWYSQGEPEMRDWVKTYLHSDGSGIGWDLIRFAWSSVADMAIIPFQDMLQLGTEARLNVPGTAEGNWAWRFTWDMLTQDMQEKLTGLTDVYLR